MPPRKRAAAKKSAPLRSVKPGETTSEPASTKPEPPDPMTIAWALEHGTERDVLVASRARIAEAIDNKNTAARDLAALTKRLGEVTNELKAYDARVKQEADEGVAEIPDEPFDETAI